MSKQINFYYQLRLIGFGKQPLLNIFNLCYSKEKSSQHFPAVVNSTLRRW